MAPAASVSHVLAACASTPTWAVGMCGQFCAAMYGYGFSGYRDALAQWQATPTGLRHTGTGTPPAGALLYWGGGSQNHGHVAISDGADSVWSIDISGPGTVSRVSAGTISARWGLPYLGWAEPYFQGERWEQVAIYGVDVSGYQPINFALTTPGDGHRVDFAIIKITEGMSFLNSKWTAQRQWARDHNLSVGFYHFGRPGNMIDQADRFLAQVNLVPGDHLWFDWEDTGISSDQKDAWISYVQGLAPGHRVGLYCNTSFWLNRDTSSFAGDGLWIATGGIPAGHPPVNAPWLIHQYSTAGDYDHDLAQFATKAEMITWAEGNEDMPLNTDDKTWISNEIAKQLKALVYGLVWDQDKTPAPDSAPDKLTNPNWITRNLLRGTVDGLAAVLAQSRQNGAGLTEIKTVLASLDLSQVPAEVAAKIEALKLIVTVEGS